MANPTSVTPNITDDYMWVKQAFFTPGTAFFGETHGGARSAKDITSLSHVTVGRRFTTAELKFTDTTPGGNFSINPKPQFTRWADIKMPGLSMDSKGMGEYYSEAVDDNAQRIHLQFGVPEYNSLTNFFSRYFDSSMGHMVATGETEGMDFYAGKLLGYMLTLPFQLVCGLVNMVTKVYKFATGTPYSKFYYLKATMPAYIDTASVLLNRIGVNMGLIYGQSPVAEEVVPEQDHGPAFEQFMDSVDNGYGLEAADGARLYNQLLPEIMGENGGIDVYMLISRSQRLHAQQQSVMSNIERGSSAEEYEANIRAKLSRNLTSTPAHGNLPKYLNEFYNKTAFAKQRPADRMKGPEFTSTDGEVTAINDAASAAAGQRVEVANSWLSDTMDTLGDMLSDGTAFVTFSVDYEGSVGESFSNSTKPSQVAEMLNGMSSQARSVRYSFADGNFMDNPIADVIGGVMNSVKDFAMGAISSLSLDALTQLAGSGYAAIPEMWDNSSANLPRTNYTIRLGTPYGNKLSIFTNIYVPLCLLLAGALPRSTGHSSYGPPFICRLWSRGRTTVQMGIIDSISIERGVGGIGWSVDGLPTAVDVNFSIVSLDKNMNIPMMEMSSPASVLKLPMFNEDSNATDYLAALGGIDLYEQYYFKAKLSLSTAALIADINSWASPARWMAKFAHSPLGRLISIPYVGSKREAR